MVEEDLEEAVVEEDLEVAVVEEASEEEVVEEVVEDVDSEVNMFVCTVVSGL